MLINEPITVAPAGGAGGSVQLRNTKLRSIPESPPAWLHLTSLAPGARISSTATPSLYFSLLIFNSLSVSPDLGALQRCWLVQRWSLCACSRPNRSIFGLSSKSSRRTTPDRGLLSFMMWVDPLSFSCVAITKHWWCNQFSVFFAFYSHLKKYFNAFLYGLQF